MSDHQGPIPNGDGSIGRYGSISHDSWPLRGPARIRNDFDIRQRFVGHPCDNVLIESTEQQLLSVPFIVHVFTNNHAADLDGLPAGIQPQVTPAWQNTATSPPQTPLSQDEQGAFHVMTVANTRPDDHGFTGLCVSVENGGEAAQYLDGKPYQGFEPLPPDWLTHGLKTKFRLQFVFVLDARFKSDLVDPLAPVNRIHLDRPLPASSEWMDSIVIRLWQPQYQSRFVTFNFRILDDSEDALPEDPEGYYQCRLYAITSIQVSDGSKDADPGFSYRIYLRRISKPFPSPFSR